MEVEKTGFNINNKIDIEETGKKYINYFYKCWNDDISTLIKDNFIKKYTRFQYKNATHKYEDFLLFLEYTKENNILNKMSIKEIQIMPSGSRRMDILVSGIITENNKITSSFTQYFLIVSEPKEPESWFLQNTMLNEISFN